MKTLGLAPLAAAPLLLAACGTLRVPPAPDAEPPPNFVLIVADDLGYGDLGCYGAEHVRTPALDALAAGGLRFTDFHSNGAVCSPTRAALFTGRYQQRAGIEGVVTAARHRHTGLGLEEATLAEVLGSRGYSTALFGKWHLGYPVELHPPAQGFDEFRGFVSGNVDYRSKIDQTGEKDWWIDGELEHEAGYLTDLIADHAERFLEANRDRPFCLVLGHGAPHYPIQGPDDMAERVVGNPRPIVGGRKDVEAGYAEMVASLDASVGRVVETLRRLGIERRTLVLFTSDNGPAKRFGGSSGGLRGQKASLWEGGHRVPAVASWPGRIPAGTVCEGPALTMDVLPTFAALAGAEAGEMDGIDLSGALLEGAPIGDRELHWHHNGRGAVRRGPFKAVETKDAWQLFDLGADRGETTDLAGDRPELLDELRALHERWGREVRDGVVTRS